MKKSMKLAFALFALSQNVFAVSVIPKFNLTGTWQAVSGGTANIFQEGTEVTIINIDNANASYFVGRYINPTLFQGISHRITRSNGCATELLVTFRAATVNSISVAATALDSNCDVLKGQKFTDSSTRTR